jgi:hypothetical protein
MTTQKPLSSAEIERLAEDWSRDETMSRRLCVFLEQFGPSGSEIVEDFFKWVRIKHNGIVTYHQMTNPTQDEHTSSYTIEFPEEIDEVAYTLRFR